eukprot:1008908-Pleurochrysis_carterae.AAC.7
MRWIGLRAQSPRWCSRVLFARLEEGERSNGGFENENGGVWFVGSGGCMPYVACTSQQLRDGEAGEEAHERT